MLKPGHTKSPYSFEVSMTDTDHLKALGAGQTAYADNNPQPYMLETFQAPTWSGGGSASSAQSIHIEVPEFTSLCPKTGQPDFATIVIDYSPRKLCIESKSLKLYMFAFRNVGEFHESCVHRIITDLVTVLDPWWIQVQGQFTPRGGIPFWPTENWEHPEL